MKYLLKRRGFTLIEILVVVLIIGILGAIALPQYQRAVLKSRFAALMPIAKSMADSNEAFYLEHGEYADNAEDLPVQGRRNYSDGTELEFGTLTGYSYVLATRDNDFPNNYIVYQKHSEQFPGEIHCEAAADNTQAQEVCKSFGPTQELGETLTSGYLTYVLFGTGNGEAPTGDEGGNEPSEPEEPETPTCAGVTCDAQGNITECASGKTLNNGTCEDCTTAFPGATSCSATSYAATACNTGYVLNGTACITQTAALQALAAAQCPANQTQYVCTIKNGKVYQCDTNSGTIDSATGECVSNGTQSGTYERIYDADGKMVEYFSYQDNLLGLGETHSFTTDDGTFKLTSRYCASGRPLKGGICRYGYSFGSDITQNSRGNITSSFTCANISTTGACSNYKLMWIYDNSYSTNGMNSYVQKQCSTATDSNPESTCSGSWVPVSARQYNEAGSSYKEVKCYNSSNNYSGTISATGSCSSSYPYVKSYDSATGQYTTCGTTAASVNWETATCK